MGANLINLFYGLGGTLVGGLITYLVNRQSYEYQLRKEREQGERDFQMEKVRIEEEKKRLEEESRLAKEKEYHDVLSNCYKFLSLHLADTSHWGRVGGIPGTDKFVRLNDCIHWVTELSLYPMEKSDELSFRIYMFLESPTEFSSTSFLFKEITKLFGLKQSM